jgi:hypothetical protein
MMEIYESTLAIRNADESNILIYLVKLKKMIPCHKRWQTHTYTFITALFFNKENILIPR